jgi:hypothetical protein
MNPDRWLDLDRLISIKWLDKVIDPREVTYMLRGEAEFPERGVTCGLRDLTRPSMPACTKPPHPVTERHEWPSTWPATEDYDAGPYTPEETK